MTEAVKPRPLAVIREAECIGCTKCIQACPVDAILGSAQNMHTVIADECIGCKLCLPPCPVDCIDLVFPAEIKVESSELRKQKAAHIKKRVSARQKRLESTGEGLFPELALADLGARKTYVQAAIDRMLIKKSGK